MVSSALDHNKPRVLVSGLSNGLGGTEIVVGRYIKALSSYATFEFLASFEGLGVAAIEAKLNGLPYVCSFGVPDAADISDKFLKCSFNVAEWIEAIISMGRPNKLAGASVYDVNKQASKLLSIFLGRQSSRERDCADV